jgi:hypothetical protein
VPSSMWVLGSNYQGASLIAPPAGLLQAGFNYGAAPRVQLHLTTAVTYSSLSVTGTQY